MRAQPEVCRLLEASLRDGKWGGKSVLLAYISDSIRKASSTSGEVQYSDETWSAAMPMYNTGNSAAVRLLAETFGGPSLDGVQRRIVEGVDVDNVLSLLSLAEAIHIDLVAGVHLPVTLPTRRAFVLRH